MTDAAAHSSYPFVFFATTGAELAELDETLLGAFREIRDALTQERSVVVVVRDFDLLGHGTPADAAVAGALLGLTRALATEGIREGWRINALAVAGELDPVELTAWVSRLDESAAINGELIRLGNLHIGKVPV